MVSFALYGDPKTPLSTQEKELYLLNFKIENGSTIATGDIGDLFYKLVEKAFDKMESWQILICVALIVGAYLGKNYLNYKNEKKKIEAELERKKADDSVITEMLETHKELIQSAFDAGQEGRRAV